MSGKQQAKINTTKKAQDKKFPQLQQLSLEQLDNVAGSLREIRWEYPLTPPPLPEESTYRW